MKIKPRSPEFFLLSLAGTAAGLANGLLGAGGGIIVTYALARLLREQNASARDVFANVVAAMLPMTTVSAVVYAIHGNLDLKDASPFLLPAVIGGVIGALLLGRINTHWLKKFFAALVLFSGMRMIL